MRWLDLLFAHWPIEVERIRPLVPESLEIDVAEGTAWVGLIPFTMRRVGFARVPPIPTLHRFHECNVRTYVRPRGGTATGARTADRGVWFFSLDATSRLAVWGARRSWHLNYLHSHIAIAREDDVIRYAVDRRDGSARMRCVWRAGAPRARGREGDLAHFLTERYALYTCDPSGRLVRSRIWHEPWSLREAEILSLSDTLVAEAGFVVAGPPPFAWHADQLDVEAWGLEVA